MSSSPVIAPTASFGAGSMLTGGAGIPDLTGLGGLFGALMGGAGGMQTFGAGMSSVTFGSEGAPVVADAGFDINAFFATQGMVEQTVQLEDDAPAITVKGDAETVKAFMAQVKEIYQKIVLEGGLDLSGAGDSAALAGALQELGMDTETAQGVAARIETMMKLVEQYHGKEKELDAETAGTLAAMMLTVMGQAAVPAENGEAKVLSLQISTSEQTLTVSSRTLPQLPTDATGDALLRTTDGRDAKAQPPAVRVFQVDVVQEGEVARVGMFLPEPQAVDTAAATKAVPLADVAVNAKDVSLAARAPVTVQPVSRYEIVTPPEGETYYKLAADANGTETVEAVKPLPRERAQADTMADMPVKAADAGASPTHGQWMQQQRAEALANPAMPAQAAASGTGYAEQYEAIQGLLEKSQIGRQVNMQIQPLLEQGGGTVRLQLNPVELGKVTVELTIAEGKVHGAIAASEPRVVEQLARELHTLRQGLADAGLKVGEQGINLMLSNENGSGQFGQQSQNAQAQNTPNGRRSGGSVSGVTGEGAGTETSPLASSLAEWVSPDRMLDVNV